MTDIKHETKQNASHTKGPWFLTVNDPQGHSTHHIATIHGVPSQPTEDGKGQRWLNLGAHKPCYEVSDEEQQANASLMAASPRLLKALEVCAILLADYDEAEGEEGDAYREATAAIAEAKGLAA